MTRFTGAPSRIGFDFNKRRGWFWRNCHTQLASVAHHQTLHTVEQNLSILAPLGISECRSVTMSYQPEDWQTVQATLQSKGVEGSFIVVQPTSRAGSSNAGMRAKWRKLSQRYKMTVILLF